MGEPPELVASAQPPGDDFVAFLRFTRAPVPPSAEQVERVFRAEGAAAAFMLVEKFESDFFCWLAFVWDPPPAWVGDEDSEWAHALFRDLDELLDVTHGLLGWDVPRRALETLLSMAPGAVEEVVSKLAVLDRQWRRPDGESRWTSDLRYFQCFAARRPHALDGRLRRGPRRRGAGKPAARGATNASRDGPDDPDPDQPPLSRLRLLVRRARRRLCRAVGAT